MKHIVIVGAGPIGLFTAIKLKQKGVANVTVIDPRTGPYIKAKQQDSENIAVDSKASEYTRPGILDDKVFKELTTYVNVSEDDLKLTVSYSPSQHIKDAERSLYALAEEAGVNLQKKKFVSFFSKDSLVVIDAVSKEQEIIPCDLAIDCTGSKRVLMNEVNKQVAEQPFKLETVSDNPIKNYFLAYIKMDPADSALIKDRKEKRLPHVEDPLPHTLSLEKLRTQFGWQEFDEPKWQAWLFEKDKVLLYYEIPPNLPKEQYEHWLTALLELKIGKANIAFQHITSPRDLQKPTFGPFTSDVQKCLTPMFAGNEYIPGVAPLGDTQITAVPWLGSGVLGGVERTNSFLNAISVVGGEIVAIDAENYQKYLMDIIGDQAEKVIDLDYDRRNELNDAIVKERLRYILAITDSTPEEEIIIKAGLVELRKKYQDLIIRAYAADDYDKKDHWQEVWSLYELLDDKDAMTNLLNDFKGSAVYSEAVKFAFTKLDEAIVKERERYIKAITDSTSEEEIIIKAGLVELRKKYQDLIIRAYAANNDDKKNHWQEIWSLYELLNDKDAVTNLLNDFRGSAVYAEAVKFAFTRLSESFVLSREKEMRGEEIREDEEEIIMKTGFVELRKKYRDLIIRAYAEDNDDKKEHWQGIWRWYELLDDKNAHELLLNDFKGTAIYSEAVKFALAKLLSQESSDSLVLSRFVQEIKDNVPDVEAKIIIKAGLVDLIIRAYAENNYDKKEHWQKIWPLYELLDDKDAMTNLLHDFKGTPVYSEAVKFVLAKIASQESADSDVLNHFIREIVFVREVDDILDLQTVLNDALAITVFDKNKDAAKKLIEQGANINYLDEHGCSLLYRVVNRMDPQDFVGELLLLGADPNQANKLNSEHKKIDAYYAKTPLMAAAENGSKKVIIKLLEAGVDPYETNHKNKSALGFANRKTKAFILKWLKDHPELRQAEKGSPIQSGLFAQQVKPEAELEDKKEKKSESKFNK